MIAAGVLGLLAIVVLGYVFFGGSSKAPTNSVATTKPSPTPRNVSGAQPTSGEVAPDDPSNYQPVSYNGTKPAVSEADRNIFAYYVPPPKPTPTPYVPPTPSPTPTPPLTAVSLAPSNVYARTPSDFSLQLMGDKFTPAVRIVIDGRELPTRFINERQLFTTVPATMIVNPGARQVMARTTDGKLYSNTVTLNVTPPPDPNSNYTYVGIILKVHFNDTAVLQDKSNKELINVQRGETVGGRFRIVSISDKEIKLIDTTLKIPHTIRFSTDQSPNSPYRPPVRSSDDEP